MAKSAEMIELDLREKAQKWAPFLDDERFGKVVNEDARKCTALMMQNLCEVSPDQGSVAFHRDQEYLNEAHALIIEETQGVEAGSAEIGEDAPVGHGGDGLGLGGIQGANTGTIAGYDPVMIPIVRRAMPRMISYEVCGVQGMKMPTQLIFALKARARDRDGNEILFHEGDTRLAGDNNVYKPTDSVDNIRAGTESSTADGDTTTVSGESQTTELNDDPANVGTATATITTGTIDEIVSADGTLNTDAKGLVVMGFETALAERTGRGGVGDPEFQKIVFSIERTSVRAKNRQLESEYSIELAQDLKAVHGMDAEKELASILANELLFEVNRHVVRTIYRTAVHGARVNVRKQGVFNLDSDGKGRWLNENFQSLYYQIQRDANAVGQRTRRGKANIMICSADVASALDCLGKLTYTPNLDPNLPVDDTQQTYVGMLGRIKVFVDPYTSNYSDIHFYLLGYKGAKSHDAGLYYCPYIPIQMVRAVHHGAYNNKLAMKSRYGLVNNPFVVMDANLEDIPDAPEPKEDENYYYSRTFITNLS